MYTSERECAEVHKKKCHIFSHVPWPEQGAKAGQSLSEAEGAVPAGPHFSFTFHWLGNGPQGSSGKGGSSLGIGIT